MASLVYRATDSYLMWSYLFFLVQLDTTAYIIIVKLIMGLSL